MINIHNRLIRTVTVYDQKQSSRRDYNPYALGQYFKAVQEVEEALTKGEPLRSALVMNFCGRLLDACLKAVDLPKSTKEEQMFISRILS